VIENLKGVFNEKSCCPINPVCSGNDCRCSHSRSATAEQGPSNRVSIAGRPSESTVSEAIRLARELGYIEGQTIAIEYRYAEGKRDRPLELATELVRLKVDIIVVAGGGNCSVLGYELRTVSRRYSLR
jgi:hypothetical protein